MRILTKIGAVALAGAMLAGGVVQAQEMQFFRIGTGSAGGTYFPIGGLISTNASAHNVTAINAGQMEAGLTGAATLYFEKFEGKAKKKLRIIANLYPEDLHLVLQKGEQLGSLKELEGQRVGIAQAGSGTQIGVELMLGVQGITRDNIKEAELNNSQSAERIADGQLDAYFYVAGTPVAAMIQLDNTKGMELYSFTDDEIAASNKAVPFYVRSLIPAGTYAGIQYDVDTLAVNGILVTSSDLDEELIYGITKALWGDQARRLLDTGHAKGKAVTLETALDGILSLDVPIHPGAERFYKEVGMLQ